MKQEQFNQEWDLIVIGGGVTGAGVLREAVRAGLKTLLIEARDFAWGTSSRSSKLVHGGLRYLKEGKIFLTYESVRERERLLQEAPGLVEGVDFMAPVYKGVSPGRFLLEAGLSVYSFMAMKRRHKYFRRDELLKHVSRINRKGLTGGFQFMDAQVDDARLVLRLINEAVKAGGSALNYTSVREIVRNVSGDVAGVAAEDAETGKGISFSAPAVINATGAWAEGLHASPNPNRRLRPLRGSHLIFPGDALPIDRAVSFTHPADNRPVFAVPWEGVVLLGTTDMDHESDLSLEPSISRTEVQYLMEALSAVFPNMKLTTKDCIATIAGVRPVLSSGGKDPSKESREHVVWVDKGLVTITGGKLTTFRLLALDALKAARPFIKSVSPPNRKSRIFDPVSPDLSDATYPDTAAIRRLFGRYGSAAADLLENASPGDLTPIPGTYNLWAELPHAAKHENIRHLTDLLLRRVRIGILTPEGGRSCLEKVKALCAPVLGWNEQRWAEEIELYQKTWDACYSLPEI